MIDEPLDEYLWDRSGEPDDDLRTLEVLLSRYRFDPPPDLRLDEVDGADKLDHD